MGRRAWRDVAAVVMFVAAAVVLLLPTNGSFVYIESCEPSGAGCSVLRYRSIVIGYLNGTVGGGWWSHINPVSIVVGAAISLGLALSTYAIVRRVG